MIYMNHAGTSWPKPAPVRAAVVTALEASPDTWAASLAQHHAEVCRGLGVGDTDRLLLTPGGTSALAVGIGDHFWEAGDRILISGLEHHALHRPALMLADRGVEVSVVPRDGNAPLDLDALRMELRRGKVKMVAMTAAANVTGEMLPVGDIVRLAHEHDALCLVDAAQWMGWQDIDVKNLGVDLLAFAGHKGLQGPWGIGGLYVAPGVTMASPRATCEVPVPGEDRSCAPMPGYCDVGSVDRAALAGLAAGLQWLASPALADRLERGREGIRRLESELGSLPGVRLRGVGNLDRRLPTLALTAAGHTSPGLGQALMDRGIVASGGQQCAPLAHETLATFPDGVLRLSLGPAQSPEEVEQVIDAVRGLLVDSGSS